MSWTEYIRFKFCTVTKRQVFFMKLVG